MYDGCARREAYVQGIVLAGVHAWGDCALEDVMTRPLLPVAGRPVIAHGLAWLQAAGVRGATICGNSQSAVIAAALGDGSDLGLKLDYCADTLPRGPAGCARDAAQRSPADTFVVLDGTVIPAIDLPALLAAHRRSGAAATVLCCAEPGGGHGPAGVYVFSRAALEQVRPRGYQDIKEVLLPQLHRSGQLVVHEVVPGEAVQRVADAASYLAVNLWAVQRLTREDAERAGYERRGEAWVHRTARVAETAQLVGPVLVGPDSVVEAGAMVVGPASIGARSRVGREAVISRSAVWDDARIEALAIVDRSVLAHGTHVEPELVLREAVLVPRSRPASRWPTWLRSRSTRGRRQLGWANRAKQPTPRARG